MAATRTKQTAKRTEAIEQAEELVGAVTDQWVATCKYGAFFLDPGHDELLPSGNVRRHESHTLQFVENAAVVDAETADKIQQILAGTYDDGFTPSKVKQRLAREAALQVSRPGLLTPPIKSWDSLNENRVIEAAIDAGELGDEAAIRAAIKYELQANLRDGAEGPRDAVLAGLAGLLDSATQVAPSGTLPGEGVKL